MTPEVFGEFLLGLGHQVIKTKTCYWYDAQPKFYFYFPYHHAITPDRKEINDLLWKTPCAGMRYFTPSENFGKPSYNIICDDKSYDIESVDAKYARRQTRRGLEQFDIFQVPFSEVRQKGRLIFIDTLQRQGRNPDVWNEEKWERFCSVCDGLNGFDAWGAYDHEKLAALIIGFQMQDCYMILHHASITQYLPFYINNALVYYLTHQKLTTENISMVFYGPQSLDAPGSLDKFKFRMGFKQKPIKQRIVFHPFVKPLINRSTYTITKQISNRYPKSDFWRKSEGIFRFYLESE